jgi:hypothetical protein
MPFALFQEATARRSGVGEKRFTFFGKQGGGSTGYGPTVSAAA